MRARAGELSEFDRQATTIIGDLSVREHAYDGGRMDIKPWAFGSVLIKRGSVRYRLAYGERAGKGTPLVFLHGLGGSLREAVHAGWSRFLVDRSMLGIDLPGFGGSASSTGYTPGIEDAASLVFDLLDVLSLARAVVVGHSLGGAVAVLLASLHAERIERLINVEGNLVSSDCFLSRRFAEVPPTSRNGTAIARILDQIKQTGGDDVRQFGQLALQNLGSPTAWFTYCDSLAQYSESNALLDMFVSLAVPRLFICGSRSKLAYLKQLKTLGIPVATVPGSAHFPAYSNPDEYYRLISDFTQAA